MEPKKSFRDFLDSTSQTLLVKQHHVGGTPAVAQNQVMIGQFYSAWIHLASEVLLQNDVPDIIAKQRLRTMSYALLDADLLDVLGICGDAADILIGISCTTLGEFKARLRVAHPNHEKVISGLLAPIIPLVVSLFECPDVKAVSLQHVLTYLRYGKKLQIQAIGLEEKALTAYLEVEDKLATVELGKHQDLIDGMNAILRCWLRDISFKNIVPMHGNGSVAEGKLTLYEKYKSLGIDLYLKVVLGPLWASFYPLPTERTFMRVSRTIFVPKTSTKLRTISMEPVTLQYFQQGVMKRLYDFIDSHPYLGVKVQLKDQGANQRMAKEGSIYGNLATIDLSAASDSVSWDLVKAVFRRTPLLKWLYATRSKHTKLPTGEVIALRKFAPMGSALCFPVQCLIFAAVIEYVAQKKCHTSNAPKARYSVYGDDLVVEHTIIADVIDALTGIGFTVNETKSFTIGPFRESCGRDYYEGIDVSALYYRLPAYQVKKLSPDVYAALCSACNLAAERGLHTLRSYFLNMILPKSPYFVNCKDRSPQLYSSQPTNFHVRRRWHRDYQLWLGRFCTVLSKQTKLELPKDGDDVAYFVKLAQMALRKSVPSFDEPVLDVALHGSCIQLGYMEREIRDQSEPLSYPPR